MNIKKPEDRRTKQRYFGVTSEEDKRLEKEAAQMGMSVSTYIRFKLFVPREER